MATTTLTTTVATASTLHKRFPHWTKLPSSTSLPSTSHRLSPFSVPEILEIILAFLSLEHRLLASRVCRAWYAASQRSIRKRAQWCENPVPPNQHQLLNYLGKIDSLKYVAQQRDYRDVPNVQVAWCRLREHIRQGKAHRIRDLAVQGPVDVEYRIVPLMPFLTSLTSLELRAVNPAKFSLGMILNGCPHLCQLDIRCPTKEAVPSGVFGAEPALAGTLQGPYPLQSLLLESVCIAQKTIEAAVETCPSLTKLHLLDNKEPPLPIDAPSTQIPDHGQLTRKVHSSCPKLVSYYCSESFQTRSEDMVPALDLLDNLDALGLSPMTFTPQLVSNLKASSNVLTTLAILAPAVRYMPQLSELLHSYLCSAPQLLHLDAPGILFDGELWNLKHLTSTLAATSPLSLSETKVWACRRLRTLHITFNTPQDDLDLFENCSQSSKILFGYLAQVCPKLVRLTLGRARIDCTVDGGLCLLMGLEELEHLEIKTATLAMVHLYDFMWMGRSTPSLKMFSNRMSFNEVRLQKSRRAKYLWLGWDDDRAMDHHLLEQLGLAWTSPTPPSEETITLSALQQQASHQQLHHHHHHHHHQKSISSALMMRRETAHRRSISSQSSVSNPESVLDRSQSSSSTLSSSSSSRSKKQPVCWPHLKTFSIQQSYDRRNQSQEIRGFIQKLRPEVLFTA